MLEKTLGIKEPAESKADPARLTQSSSFNKSVSSNFYNKAR